MPTLHNLHFREFLRLSEADLGWSGQIPARWAFALPGYNGGKLPEVRIRRNELRDFCADANNSDEACFAACMAWGGMRRDHGGEAWRQRAHWSTSVSLLRKGGVDREKAYDLFSKVNVAGLGPAYFTKMIYFFRPEKDGYILDQWTTKSVQLLFVEKFLSISSYGWVNRKNDAKAYACYCEAVDYIARKLEIPGDVAEEKMFSQGGRRKHPWRQYVITNWAADIHARRHST